MTERNQDFSEFLTINNILCGVHEKDGRAILFSLLGCLKRHFPELDIQQTTREVLAREEQFSTVIAPGLAFPHARIPGLKSPLVAMACIPDGTNFSDTDGIKVMILAISPVENPNIHTQLLSALAKSFSKTPSTVEDISCMKTPADVCRYFSSTKIKIADFLRAYDVMNPKPITVLETDSLRDVIEKFATTREEEFPVVDETGDLRGVVSVQDLLNKSLPEHLLWPEDLSQIYHFQPFSEELKTSGETKIADVMRDDFIKVQMDVPAIHLAKEFLVNKVRQLIVVNEHGRLVGIVTTKDFCAKLFWE